MSERAVVAETLSTVALKLIVQQHSSLPTLTLHVHTVSVTDSLLTLSFNAKTAPVT